MTFFLFVFTILFCLLLTIIACDFKLKDLLYCYKMFLALKLKDLLYCYKMLFTDFSQEFLLHISL